MDAPLQDVDIAAPMCKIVAEQYGSVPFGIRRIRALPEATRGTGSSDWKTEEAAQTRRKCEVAQPRKPSIKMRIHIELGFQRVRRDRYITQFCRGQQVCKFRRLPIDDY
ncbi:MAG: hypothetical protein AMXMBFR84_48210 [Candidatus Hydrogenedentota bacterium]